MNSPSCEYCSAALVVGGHKNKRFCSERCRKLGEQRRRRGRHPSKRRQPPKLLFVCEYCRLDVIADGQGQRPAPPYCSSCRTKLVSGPGARAKSAGARWRQKVDSKQVLDRDEWTCRGCRKVLLQEHRGTLRDDAPEVDHIIPLSAGGEHSYANVQCLCRACNMQKGNRIPPQHRDPE